MAIVDILTAERVSVAGAAEGEVATKPEALRRVAELLARADAGPSAETIERVLVERERLHSTGVGGGVGIPHGASEAIRRLRGAVLILPRPVDFDAIDQRPVSILFGLIGPKGQPGEHLKTLARVSRLLREEQFRERLLAAPSGMAAFALIAAEEGRGVGA